jgi:ribosome-associated toxin RatA of RatAB toxin-antitoxin module
MTDLDPTTKSRLSRGEVLVHTEPVPGSSTQAIVVRAVFDFPAEAVWRHIDQSARYHEFMPRVKASAELSRDGENIRTRMTVDMPFPLKNLTATTRARHIVEPGVRYVREWKLEEGDYHVNEGSWTLTPFDGDPNRAYAHYRVHVMPKIPIPKAIQSAVQEKAMPKLIESLRERTKTHR